MKQVPVIKIGSGDKARIQHWSHGMDQAQVSTVTRAVCDGDVWTLYENGEKSLPEHTDAHLHRNAKKPDAPKPAPQPQA